MYYGKVEEFRRSPQPRGRFGLQLLIVVLACMNPLSAYSQSPVHRQLTLIHPDDQEFELLLSTNFPGIGSLDGYPVFRPYLILLRNDTPLAARAYMVVWETMLSTGRSRRTANLIERYDPSLASERVALAPGQLRLVSPAFDVSPQEYQSHLRSWVARLMSIQQTHLPYSLSDTKSITPSVDAAIFADGACAGADHYRIFTRYEQELTAERDLADAVLKMLDAKASETDVIAFLKNEADASAAESTSQSGDASVYAFHRGRQAQELLALHKRGGIESVVTRAWRVKQHSPQKLSRVSSQ